MRAQRSAVFEALEKANEREREFRRRRETPVISSGARIVVGSVAGLAYVFSIALAIAIGNGVRDPHVRDALGISLIVVYCGVFYYPVAELWLRRRMVSTALARPESVLLANAKLTLESDEDSLTELMLLPVEDVEFVAMEVRAERDGFARRIGLLVGAIDTLGIFPALLAFVVALSQIEKDMTQWVSVVVYATPWLYLMGMWGQFQLMRLERNCRMMELVGAWKRSDTNRR